MHSSKRDMLSARIASLYAYGIQNCTIRVWYKIRVWYRTVTPTIVFSLLLLFTITVQTLLASEDYAQKKKIQTHQFTVQSYNHLVCF